MQDLLNSLAGVIVAAGVFGIIFYLAILFGLFYLCRRLYYALKGEEYVPMFQPKGKYEHMDIDKGSTAEDIAKVFRRYARLDTVGKYAQAGKTTIEGLDTKYEGFYATLKAKFQRGTITWDKFAVGGESVYQTVLRNCAVLANRIQTFDREDYRQLSRQIRNASYSAAAPLNTLQQQKWQLLKASLADMDAIITSNEQLLFELDKLASELDKLQNAGLTEESEQLLDEVRTLIDETKYYRQAQ